MRVCAVIPARMGSTRFYGKPLHKIHDKSMIQHVYENVSKSELLDEVFVATDHTDIYKHVNSFGGKVIMTSESCKNGTERVYEVSREYADFDYYVNIQGDEPLIDYSVINQTLSGLVNNPNCDIGTIATNSVVQEDFRNRNRVKVVTNKNNEALYFSRSAIPFQEEKNSAEFLVHIGLYVYKKSFLDSLLSLAESKLEKLENLEQLKFMDNGFKINVETTSYQSIGVDTLDDVKIIENILNGE